MVHLWTIIIVAVTLGTAAILGAIWAAAEDFWFGRFARRMRQSRFRSKACITPTELLKPDRAADDVDAISDAEPRPWQIRVPSLTTLLEHARSPLSRKQFLLLTVLLGVLGALGGLALHVSLWLNALAAGLPLAIPLAWLLWRRNRRIKKFEQQLPEAFETIANSLRSGQALAVSLRAVADMGPDPLAPEFAALCDALNMGASMDDALRELARRVPSAELRFFVAAMRLHHREGGNIGQVLDMLGRAIRERRRLKGQVRAISAEGRLSGVILMALPLLAFAAVDRLAPKYVEILFDDPFGRKMLIAAVLLQLVGAAAIRKIVNVPL